MTFSDFHFFSQSLGIQTSLDVLLPEPKVMAQQNGAPLPTLYLLHGLSDDHTIWMRQTRIEQYASRYRVAVVMPAVNRSFYTDMAHGAKYFTYVSEELPAVMESYFPLSSKREERFAAGNSMGGYGAIKLGLSCPERYSYVASLSGALEMEKAYEPETRQDEAFLKELDDIYGGREALQTGDGNLSLLAEELCAEYAPRMYMACGTEDFLFGANESFAGRFGEKFSIAYTTEPGEHTWDFWDRHIQRVLAWLPLVKAENVW